MKKEIRVVQGGVVQVTIADERFYGRPHTNPTTGVPDGYEFVPSVTWIASYYPKGVGFYKWLANTGWDEAEALKQAAGDRGSKVHQAIGDLLAGHPVKMDALYAPADGAPAPLTLEEYDCLLAFRDWWEGLDARRVVDREFVVWHKDGLYAGTVDLLCEFAGRRWLIDLKTGQQVWPEHRLQVSAYKHSLPADLLPVSLGILQLGYRANKRGWKFTEVEDQFPLFLATREIWANETAGVVPLKKDYPLEILLTGLDGGSLNSA